MTRTVLLYSVLSVDSFCISFFSSQQCRKIITQRKDQQSEIVIVKKKKKSHTGQTMDMTTARQSQDTTRGQSVKFNSLLRRFI